MMKHTLAIATAMALIPTAGFAATEDEKSVIEEIVVTATHRETNLMETPQSISAVSGEFIEQLGAVDMQDLFKNIAGLNMTEGSSAGNNRYIVRGVSSQTGAAAPLQTLAAVSVYLDDVPMTLAQGPALQFGGNLFDINRVEVLKGPQGTLFGEGSVGGTIRFIQNDPDITALDYKLKIGTSVVDESDERGRRIDGMLNVPLADNAALRLTAFHNDRPGYYDKLDTNEKDTNNENAEGVRVALLWAPDERWTVKPTIYSSTTKTTGANIGFKPYEENFNVRNPGNKLGADEEVTIYSLNVDYKFDWATLRLFGSFLDREVHTRSETPAISNTFLDIFLQLIVLGRAAQNPLEIPTMLSEGWALDFGVTQNVTAYGTYNIGQSERTVFEARLLSKPTGSSWRWTAGVFWKSSKDLRRQSQPFLLRPSLTQESAPTVYAAYYALANDPANQHWDTLDDISAYGELTYAFSDTLEVTLGARISDMEQSIGDALAGTSDTVVSPKFGIAWYPVENTLTYLNVSTGFRPGNQNLTQDFNLRLFRSAGDTVLPNVPPISPNPAGLTGNEAVALLEPLFTYDGDSVVNYEIGVKSRLTDRVNVTAAVYYFDWQDTILTFQEPRIPHANNSYNDNAGAAHAVGVDVEVVAQLSDAWRLRLSGDVNEAELDEAFGDIPSGTELPNAPQWSFAANVEHHHTFGNGWVLLPP